MSPTMKLNVAILGLLLSTLFAVPVSADVRELSRNELRENVRLGKSLSFSQLQGILSRRVEGQAVDVRAFQSRGIYYRVVIRKPGGALSAVVLNAESGRFLGRNSQVAKDVMIAARKDRTKAVSGAGNEAASNAGASGSGNANGNGNNGNGNGGGNNGNGNGGGNNGNGNGNGGGNNGNGNGNGGGNGNGKNK